MTNDACLSRRRFLEAGGTLAAAERFLAKRMRAQVLELPSSHASLLSHRGEIAGLIRRAAR